MFSATPHRALYSLHDVTPAKEALVFAALEHMRALGIDRIALLVVPDFHARADLRQFPAFCQRLRAAMLPGDEVLLHGYYHLAGIAQPQAPQARSRARGLMAAALTAGEGEFHELDHAEASRRIHSGLDVLRDALDLTPSGFVAPAWLQNDAVRRAVADAGLTFSEDHLRIWPARSPSILAPALSFASRTPLRLWASVAHAELASRVLPRQSVSRVAIHPNDYRSPHLRRAIDRTVRRWMQSSTPARSAEVLP